MLKDGKKDGKKDGEGKGKRKPKLTYVSGEDGRRYVNDKILRNLEQSQGGRAYSDFVSYSTVSNYEANGYLSYDDLAEETQKLTEEAGYQGEQQNSWGPQEQGFSPDQFDQSAKPPALQGFNITQGGPEHDPHASADVANADLEAAFQKASGARTVSATYQDLALGAFQAHAVNNPQQVEVEAHGYDSQAQVAAENVQPPKHTTSEVHTTVYDGYHDPAYESVFGANAHTPPPVPVRKTGESSKVPSASKDDYKKLLGGLFHDESSSGGGQQADPGPTESSLAPHPSQQQQADTLAYTMQQQVPADAPVVWGAPSTPAPPTDTSSVWGAPPGAVSSNDSGSASHAPAPENQYYADQQDYSGQQEQQYQQDYSSGQQDQQYHQDYSSGQQDQYQSGQQEYQEEQPYVQPKSPDELIDQPTQTVEPPKPKYERKKPPLPKQRQDEIYFEDNANSGKTAIFKMPKEGVVRSSRGTVELLVHKGGRMFRPSYNAVGILLRVDVSDGFSLIKGEADKAPWIMADREGNALDEDAIHTVAFDKKGNLWYETVTGKKTKFLVDGGVEVTNPDGQKTKL